VAKSARDELFERLRVGGLRKSVAKRVADGLDGARGKAPQSVQSVIDDLKALTAELEDRAKGGPGKRQAAARKGAATRKRQAEQRSAAARKAARTRARKTSAR
jgi:Skp family chaperone for outer membrane proteins